MIPKKPMYDLDTEINSETIQYLRRTFFPISRRLDDLVFHLQHIHLGHRVITVAILDSLREPLGILLVAISKTLTDLESHLIPSLNGVEPASTEKDFNTWSLALKELWVTTTLRSLDLISSLEVATDQQLAPED
ncbi:hypothetical protein KEM48_002902 [Puccinia striiformis f. sp. tritici PST-130]|nr:hypothetical protein KEM48_002902 [Puccinia striiformis f. sp. tritici PST-130]